MSILPNLEVSNDGKFSFNIVSILIIILIFNIYVYRGYRDMFVDQDSVGIYNLSIIRARIEVMS